MIVRWNGNYDVHLRGKKLTKTHVKATLLAHHPNTCIHHTMLTDAMQKQKPSQMNCVFRRYKSNRPQPKNCKNDISFQSMHNA